MIKEPIRFVIVGLGYIGQRHAAIIAGHENCRLIAVCDNNPEKSTLVDVPFFTDLDTLLATHSDFDVLCVCTPNGLHLSQAIAGVKKGFHVLVEKPLGLNTAQGQDLARRAAEQNRRVFCVMQNRYSPPSAWLKKLISSGVMGHIQQVQVNCFWNRDDRYYQQADWRGSLSLDGGPLFTQFSHFVDILYWLFGDIDDIQANFANYRHQANTEFEDSGQVIFTLPGGTLGSFHYTTATHKQNFESSITIIGEKGTVRVGGQYMDRIEHCEIEGYTMPVLAPSNPPNDYGHYKGSAANHHFVFQNVVDTLRGNSKATTNLDEGLQVVDMIERIYKLRK